MRQQITRLSVHQTAKVFAVIYGLLGFVFLPFVWIVSAFSPQNDDFGGGVWLLIFPAIYAVFGYIFTAIGCVIYNWVAGMIGGIEVELAAPAGEA